MRIVTICLVAFAAMCTVAAASTPAFTNGPLVARKMEAHYNGAAYKAKLAKGGARLTSRVLCAYDRSLRMVECDGKANIPAAVGTTRYNVSVQWELEKLAPKRARLRWTMSGSGAYRSDHEIIAPSAYGLRRF